MSSGRPLSLLWPEGMRGAPAARLDDQAIADLHLDEIVRAIVSAGAPAGRLATRERFAHDVLTTLITEPDIIAYRQAVLTDLLDNPPLRERLERALPALEALGDLPRAERYRPTAEPGLERVARRLADLELRVGLQRQLGLQEVPDKQRITEIAEAWRPYRSIATWYLWRSFGPVPQST